MKRLNIDLEDDLHQRLKVRAAAEGTTVSRAVRSLLMNWVVTSWDEAKLMEVSVVEATPGNVAAGTRLIKPISKSDQAKGRSRR